MQSNGSISLAVVDNAGPLSTAATALFGYDSFLAARLNHQEAFIRDYNQRPQGGTETDTLWAYYLSACNDQVPLSSMLQESLDCITGDVKSSRELDLQMARYVRSFYPSSEEQHPYASRGSIERLENAFASAVYLATEAWLTLGSDFRHSSVSREVYSDPGADAAIPAISRVGMILVSSLWTVYIACLFGLAVYSARIPRWANQLDAFAMMRIGAATNGQISLDVGFKSKAIDMLDKTYGFIGDATGGEGDIGVLGLGAATPLNGVRPYKCYLGDEVKIAEAASLDQRNWAFFDVEINGKMRKVRTNVTRHAVTHQG